MPRNPPGGTGPTPLVGPHRAVGVYTQGMADSLAAAPRSGALRPELRGLLVFLATAFGLVWLASVPLWAYPLLRRSPLVQLALGVVMFTPAAGTALTVFVIRREPDVPGATGLRFRPRQAWPYWLFAWLAVPVYCLVAPFIGQALGFVELDVRGLSGVRELLHAAGPVGETLPAPLLAAVQVAVGVTLGPLLNAPFAFGEEWGWRGYLLPKLLPLGVWPALLASGAIWGLWHAPLILLGHNYPLHPRLGVAIMIAFCMVFGTLLGWMRLSTGSIWPAVIAHGALNATGGVLPLLVRAGSSYDSVHVGITGWTGWILPLATVLVLIATRRMPAIGRGST